MCKKIKLLFVLENLIIGGPQKSLIAILEQLDYKDFDVSVISLEPNGVLEKSINPKVKIIQANPIYTAFTLPKKNNMKYLKVLIKNRMYLESLFYILMVISYFFNRRMNPKRQWYWHKFRFSIPSFEGCYDAAFGVSGGLSTYFIIDCVNAKRKFHWVRGDYSRVEINKEIDEFYFEKIDGSLAVSEECCKFFVKMFPFMENKMYVFLNSIPLAFYDKQRSNYNELDDSRNVKILTVSRLDPDKGLELAIDALWILKKKGYQIDWYILGDGRFRKKLEKAVLKKKLENNFIFLGYKLNVFDYIERCDIFVHPSRSEGRSNAVEEAKFLNKLIVATNYKTVGEQIQNGFDGFICDMNGESIANTIENFFEGRVLKRINLNPIARDINRTDPNHFFKEIHSAPLA